MAMREITAEILAAEVLEATPLVMYFLRRHVRQHGQLITSIPQVRLLAYLRRYPGASLSEVADGLGVTKATTSNLVDRLVRMRLVQRTEDPQERRCVILNLTGDGEERFQEVRQLAVRELGHALRDLSPAKMRQISDGICLLQDIFAKLNVSERQWLKSSKNGTHGEAGQ